MGSDNPNIARTIFDSMVFLTYKGLVTRSVDTIEPGSQQLDAMTEQLKRLPNDLCQFQALSPDITAILQLSEASHPRDDARSDDVGAIIDECIAMLKSKRGINRDTLIGKLEELKSQIDKFKGDVRAAADIVNRVGRFMIDIEMQRSKQAIIEARVFQYGAIMLLSRSAPNLLPLVLISICQWGNTDDGAINDVFHAGIGQNSDTSISISQMTINILKVKGAFTMKSDQRKNERKRVKDIFKASLRKRYPKLIKDGESFKSLWSSQAGDDAETQIEKRNLRTAYEVLCFLRLAPLTPQLGNEEGNDKNPNPVKNEQLGDGQLRTRIFNPTIREAYNLMNTNNVSNPGAQEQYLGVWSAEDKINEMQQRIEAQQRKIDEVARQSAINGAVNSILTIIRIVPNELRRAIINQWANETFSERKNLGIRQAIIDQIKDRQNEFGKDVVAILENEYNRIVKLERPQLPQKEETVGSSVRRIPEPPHL
jgi:hypothetical protein